MTEPRSVQAREILVVDDEVGIRELLSEILQDEGYRVVLAENAGEARAYRQRQQPALVLLDIWMPDTDGVTLLREWGSTGLLTMPVVMMSGHGTIETAVEATKIGAFDFLEKPIGLNKLLATIARAFKTVATREPRRLSLAALGVGAAVRETEKALDALVAARRPVLILGEPGTGHETAARALAVSGAPFVAVANGARLTSNPLALIEEAREGVIWCSEIGQYTRAEQRGLAFLLPKLDKHNILLVATSSEMLAAYASDGRFDAALLAQLAPGAVVLPPLRARREDIPALIERFWRETAVADRAQPLLVALPPAALTALTNAWWPGNLDHLRGVIANMLVVHGELTPDHVKRLLGESASPSKAIAPEITTRFFELPLREAREAFERIYFEQLLGREQSNMSRVAEKAGLERTHLYRKLKQLNIRFSRRSEESAG
ncbi:MAG: sigma-54-dependent Fis family transcriptional regulator [Proteobacteria bacterium]|jgi:DNA-binding NtrC family response regulator|nr:sigma-54-dependent Fis family transcriptional regulator [Pseudomonadota bacterium]